MIPAPAAVERNLKNVEDVAVTVAPATNVVAEGFERQETALQKANKSFKDYAEASKEVEANLRTAAFKGLQKMEDGLA